MVGGKAVSILIKSLILVSFVFSSASKLCSYLFFRLLRELYVEGPLLLMSFVIMGVLAYCLPYGWLFLSVFMAAVIYEPKKEDSQGVLFSMDYEAGRNMDISSLSFGSDYKLFFSGMASSMLVGMILGPYDKYGGDGLIVLKQ